MGLGSGGFESCFCHMLAGISHTELRSLILVICRAIIVTVIRINGLLNINQMLYEKLLIHIRGLKLVSYLNSDGETDYSYTRPKPSSSTYLEEKGCI